MRQNALHHKVGFMNMTIDFSEIQINRERLIQKKAQKLLMSARNKFETRISPSRKISEKPFLGNNWKRQQITQKAEENNLSSFQVYKKIQKNTVVNLRNHRHANLQTSRYILGLSPCGKNKIQVEFQIPKFQEQQILHSVRYLRQPKGNSLFTKRRLKNTIQLHGSKLKTASEGQKHFQNPEEELKAYFTIRTAKTSQKLKGRKHVSVQEIKRQEELNMSRKKFKQLELQQIRNIRPWSTRKQAESKQIGIFDSSVYHDIEKNTQKN